MNNNLKEKSIKLTIYEFLFLSILMVILIVITIIIINFGILNKIENDAKNNGQLINSSLVNGINKQDGYYYSIVNKRESKHSLIKKKSGVELLKFNKRVEIEFMFNSECNYSYVNGSWYLSKKDRHDCSREFVINEINLIIKEINSKI